MKIIGLTGGIASGKNFIADIFKQKGAMVFDADAQVHAILNADEDAISRIKAYFPESITDHKIDRKKLGQIVFSNTEKLQILEHILHPKVKEKYRQFLKKAHQRKVKLVILNIPLLLERKQYACDKIIAIITSRSVQKHRFLKRCKKMNGGNFAAHIPQLEKRFEEIVSRQVSNHERKKQADFVIFNGLSRHHSIRQVASILRQLQY